MMSEALKEIIVLVGPYVLSCLMLLPTVVGFVKTFMGMKSLHKQVIDLKEMRELRESIREDMNSMRAEMTQLLDENRMLRQKLNEQMTLIDHIQRKD